MTHVIAIAMQKGGVGKTTTTINLGAYLGQLGFRVLLVDIDPQANLSKGLGVELDQENPHEYSVYDVLLNPNKGIDYAIRQTSSGVDILPSTLRLAGAELEVAGQVGREMLLRDALASAKSRYDFVLIDAPPSLGIFFLNAIGAADDIIIPVVPEIFPYDAFNQLEASIRLMQKLNPTLAISGVLITKYDARTKLSKAIIDQVRKRYGDLVFTAIVPNNVTLAEAPVSGAAITIYDPSSAGARAYQLLAHEVAKRYHYTNDKENESDHTD